MSYSTGIDQIDVQFPKMNNRKMTRNKEVWRRIRTDVTVLPDQRSIHFSMYHRPKNRREFLPK
jgi:hypothetical protein